MWLPLAAAADLARESERTGPWLARLARPGDRRALEVRPDGADRACMPPNLLGFTARKRRPRAGASPSGRFAGQSARRDRCYAERMQTPTLVVHQTGAV